MMKVKINKEVFTSKGWKKAGDIEEFTDREAIDFIFFEKAEKYHGVELPKTLQHSTPEQAVTNGINRDMNATKTQPKVFEKFEKNRGKK